MTSLSFGNLKEIKKLMIEIEELQIEIEYREKLLRQANDRIDSLESALRVMEEEVKWD
jgi:hypothetical protein